MNGNKSSHFNNLPPSSRLNHRNLSSKGEGEGAGRKEEKENLKRVFAKRVKN